MAVIKKRIIITGTHVGAENALKANSYWILYNQKSYAFYLFVTKGYIEHILPSLIVKSLVMVTFAI